MKQLKSTHTCKTPFPVVISIVIAATKLSIAIRPNHISKMLFPSVLCSQRTPTKTPLCSSILGQVACKMKIRELCSNWQKELDEIPFLISGKHKDMTGIVERELLISPLDYWRKGEDNPLSVQAICIAIPLQNRIKIKQCHCHAQSHDQTSTSAHEAMKRSLERDEHVGRGHVGLMRGPTMSISTCIVFPELFYFILFYF